MATFQDPHEWASSFSALGFSEFYRNQPMKRQKTNYPILLGKEAGSQEVYGFGADLYCPYCDETFDFILIEFENTLGDRSLSWGELNLEEFKVDLLKCPKCGNREMVFGGI